MAGLSDGELTSGVDAVSENDVLGVPWEHRIGTGPVVVTTTADCHPMETSWALADTAGTAGTAGSTLHNEAATLDTLCLAHGCYDVLLNDNGADGFSGGNCGMQGALNITSMAGAVIWSVTDTNAVGIGFSTGVGGTVCLPVPGVLGCTNQAACNFDPAASEDDGSCNQDCWTTPCPADFDGDGFYGAADILTVLLNLGVQQDARWTLLATARFLPMTSWLCWLCTVKPARNDESRCILQPLWQHELPVLKSTFAVGLQKLKALCTLWSAQNSDCAAQQLHAISSKVGP